MLLVFLLFFVTNASFSTVYLLDIYSELSLVDKYTWNIPTIRTGIQLKISFTNMSEILAREANASSQRIKTPPKASAIPTPFSYSPSDDGTDENLLILLHGLGDTHTPFFKLGRQLKLPQTATLALRAPENIPYLYEEAYQWYPSFDDLGELIVRPNPTSALEILSKVLNHLTEDCAWPSDRIHFFGFAQGGSLALEFGIKFWRQQTEKRISDSDAPNSSQNLSLGSIVSVSGPLLSYPTLSSLSSTPVIAIYRPPPAEPSLSPGDLTALKKAYSSVKEVKLGAKGPGMPASREEWEPIMRFWSERLGRRQVEGLYEVMSGMAPLK
ncbi:hypothetical protein D9757_004085 [Collybiopsis confluens]|uniref:Phospholipase/carboxylesterase/thioesterase domain-containing protein n=1 Tax=Collybiopsis confluens TaxID=2823264 RepID=A0A8H5HUM4_9AGAR|nr:hypothetical protein D9757_004085 [Collybiopsis confluens]